jgi:hypothetical protein
LAGFPFRKRHFITTRRFFVVKSPLFCAIFTADLQLTLHNQATFMNFRSDIYKTVNFDVIKVGEIGKAKDLSASLRTCPNQLLNCDRQINCCDEGTSVHIVIYVLVF